jgi:hypothetical protein
MCQEESDEANAQMNGYHVRGSGLYNRLHSYRGLK